MIAPLAGLSLSWVAGVATGLKLSIPVISLLLTVPLLALAVRHRPALLLGLMLLLFVTGALRSGGLPSPGEGLAVYTGAGELSLRGSVTATEPWSQGWRLKVNVRQVAMDGQWQPVAGQVYIYLSRSPDYRPGDRLEVRGRPAPEMMGGRPAIFHPKVRLMEDSGRGPLGALHRLRQALSTGLARALPEPQASVAQALLLGQRGNLPLSLKQDFTHTGTAHLLAISGLHISVLAGIVLSLAGWALGRHRPHYLMIALMLVWLYILISGFRAPAVRAGIMASIFLWGEGIGRPRSGFTALVFAAAVMVGLSPGLLREASFQLSFAAMTGLIVISPLLQDAGHRLRIPRLVADGLAYSVGPAVVSMPLASHYFGVVPLVGVPATLAALPALPGAILASALAGGLAVVSPTLSVPFAGLAWLFLLYTMTVVGAFASLPWASISYSWGTPGLWAFYGVLAAMMLSRGSLSFFVVVSRRLLRAAVIAYGRIPPQPLSLALLLAAALVWATLLSLPSDRLEVSVLDVGTGQAILVQQGGSQVLIDGGASPTAVTTALGKRLPFWDRTIDGLVLTHPDADHVVGLSEVLRRYQVRWAMEPGIPADTQAYADWQHQLRERGIAPIIARQGTVIHLGDSILTVLHPADRMLSGTSEDIDNNGIVLRVEAGKVSFLLTGDLRREGESELLARGAPLGSSVLQVGHHGSATSTSTPFLAVVSPQAAVISSPPGAPSPSVTERLRSVAGADLYITGQRGTVTFSTDGKALWVETEW